MRSSQVVGASVKCQCQSRNSPGFDPSILVLNNVQKEKITKKLVRMFILDVATSHIVLICSQIHSPWLEDIIVDFGIGLTLPPPPPRQIL